MAYIWMLLAVISVSVSPATSAVPVRLHLTPPRGRTAMRSFQVNLTSKASTLWRPNPSGKGFGTQLRERDATYSPFKRTFKSSKARLQTYQKDDRRRSVNLADQVAWQTNGSTSSATDRKLLDFKQISRNAQLQTGVYYVNVFVGSPRQTQALIFDTGSSLCWAQCQCRTCPRPSGRVFKPASSRTFRSVKCNEGVCNNGEINRGASTQSCRTSKTTPCPYRILYGSGSSSGVMGRDTLTIAKRIGGNFALKNFLFGCQYSADGLDVTNGILGMGRTQYSLANQLSRYYNNIFSTCFVDRLSSATSQVNYGAAAVPQSGVRYTPLLTNSADRFKIYYYVQVSAVYVGGERVSVPSSALNILPGRSASGTIVDTGTTFALLKPAAWDPIFAAVARETRSASRTGRQRSGGTVFEPCWTYSQASLFPVIRFEFRGGATISLAPDDYIEFLSGTVICNVIGKEASSSLNVLGAMFMRNKILVWDRRNNRLGIKPVNCATGKAL